MWVLEAKLESSARAANALTHKPYFKLIVVSWIVLYGAFRIVHPNSGRQEHSDLTLGVYVLLSQDCC